MKAFRYLAFIAFVSVMASCGTSQKVSVADALKTDMEAQNYQAVYDKAIAEIINLEDKGKQVPDDLLLMAGESALRLDIGVEARKYLEQLVKQNPQKEDAYPLLAELYKSIDNLSFEISNYTDYFKYNPDGKYTGKMQAGLFDAYVRSENWEKGEAYWNTLNDTLKQNEKMLEGYLKVVEETENKEEMDATVQKLLALNPDNRTALKANAASWYTTAETRYKKEMDAYNKNKTRKQYAQLLKALDQSTAEFKKARDIYLKLYKAQPEKDIAKYLSNIYARLNQKDKSAYYKKLAK